MPYHGRDTIYLESLISWLNIGAGLLCAFYMPGRWDTNILALFREIIPLKLWAVFWIGVGIAQMYGCIRRRLRFVEYAALCSAGLWLVVCVNITRNPMDYPMTCVYAPTFTIYSFLIFFYQSRTSAYRKRYGRPSKAA